MRDTLFLLRLDHGKLSKLLGLIEDQVALADAGKRMDEQLLRLASEYFLDYPDRCHHPKEDLVYKLLSVRDPDSCAALRDVVSDHRRLHELAKAFADAMHSPPEEPQAGESALRRVILEFTRHYRQHLQLEEEQFFRRAEERLSKDDWDSLDFEIFDEDDPLFDHAAEKRFAALRERIERLAEQGKARRTVFGAAEGLRCLSGIDDFNESMKSAGQHFRLARFAEGGYGLASDRELLLYIPDCSAERAAWCAYSYLLGRGWPHVQQHSCAVPAPEVAVAALAD